MRRDQLEHIVRAAGAILDEPEIIVIGSQSILGSVAEARLPPAATRSVEADIVPLDDEDERKSTLVDGTIGELSPFHETFGVYAHGVGEGTARLPRGWRSRLVPLSNENTRGVTGWCLEPHDLVVAKLLAGRPHDLKFCGALLGAAIVDLKTVQSRLSDSELDSKERTAVDRRLMSVTRRGQVGETIAEGYRRRPQTDEDVAAAEAAAIQSINEEPR